MRVKNLVLANGDCFEGGDLDIPREILSKFVKLYYEDGHCGYIDPDSIMSFDSERPTILPFPKK